MFVGVVVENFHKCRQNQEVEEAKRREDKRRRRMEKKRRDAQKIPYYASYSSLRLWIHTLCTTYYLDLFITFIICINVITMSLEHYSQPRSLDLVLKYCNYFFTSTFVLETLLKLTAFGFRRFFKDRWNQLDLAIVLLSDYPCEGMSRHATFENFGMAFLTLFQVSTGDNWNGIMKDTLRECPTDYGPDYSCNPSLQFISPMYFVSFVLTAQFVLINVVVAVLMKHLDDSNKEAKEEAEMDAEIELELATGALCCMGPEGVCAGGKKGGGAGGGGGGGVGVGGGVERGMGVPGSSSGGNMHHHVATTHPGPPHDPNNRDLYSPAQESQWLDSVSLLIKDSFEGEMIDNLSGSVFHHYSSSSLPVWKDCKSHPQLEDEKGSDSQGLEEAGGGGGSLTQAQTGGSRHCRAHSSVAKEGTPLLVEVGVHQRHETPSQHSPGRTSQGLRLTSPASWASLRSPGAHSRVLCTQYPSHSDSSLATGSSDGSLQTTLEEGLSFSVSPPQDLKPPLPLLCPLPHPLPEDSTSCPPGQTLRPRPSPSSGPALTLQATRGHQRSQSSGRGSISPGYTREDSMNPDLCDLEDLGIGISSSIGGCSSSQAGNSEHLSETLSSLSLTSLLSPASLAPPGVKKCNSTGSLDQGARRGEGRQILGLELDSQGFLANPWGESGGGRGEEGQLGEATGLKGNSSSQTTVGSCRFINPYCSSLSPSGREKFDVFDNWFRCGGSEVKRWKVKGDYRCDPCGGGWDGPPIVPLWRRRTPRVGDRPGGLHHHIREIYIEDIDRDKLRQRSNENIFVLSSFLFSCLFSFFLRLHRSLKCKNRISKKKTELIKPTVWLYVAEGVCECECVCECVYVCVSNQSKYISDFPETNQERAGLPLDQMNTRHAEMPLNRKIDLYQKREKERMRVKGWRRERERERERERDRER
ncbi:unnamed protein product [Coregonus sp. 'balchen']|nr:unnamed protein product [Coregonus sp. 'balchen']